MRRRRRSTWTSSGVAPGGTLGPARPGQLLAADDGLVALDERGHESGLDRRQRHPATREPQQAVTVEVGRLLAGGRRWRRASTSTRARTSASSAGTRIQSSRQSSPRGAAAPPSTSSNLGSSHLARGALDAVPRGAIAGARHPCADGTRRRFRVCFTAVNDRVGGSAAPRHAARPGALCSAAWRVRRHLPRPVGLGAPAVLVLEARAVAGRPGPPTRSTWSPAAQSWSRGRPVTSAS